MKLSRYANAIIGEEERQKEVSALWFSKRWLSNGCHDWPTSSGIRRNNVLCPCYYYTSPISKKFVDKNRGSI